MPGTPSHAVEQVHKPELHVLWVSKGRESHESPDGLSRDVLNIHAKGPTSLSALLNG